MLTRCLAAGLLLGVSVGLEAADERTCSPHEAQSAENGVGRLRSWADLHRAFGAFAHCDDGAIAEGYSDFTMKMLVRRWTELRSLQKLAVEDTRFLAFVLRHIDATWSEAALQRAAKNATSRCPTGSRSLCSAIEERARELQPSRHSAK